MNKSAVRRALTTLKKNSLISEKVGWTENPNKVVLTIVVDADLIQPKKKIYIRKNKIQPNVTTNNKL